MGLLYRYRSAQMVIKTDPCAFTEMKIYPGRGSKFAGKDGKVHFFVSSKARSLFHQKIKPVNLTWTQASRRFNKKIKVEDIQKKRTRKTTRVQKAVVGMSLDEIRRRRTEDVAVRDKALEASKKEIRERNVKKMQSKKSAAGSKKTAAATKAPVAKAANAPKASKKQKK